MDETVNLTRHHLRALLPTVVAAVTCAACAGQAGPASTAAAVAPPTSTTSTVPPTTTTTTAPTTTTRTTSKPKARPKPTVTPRRTPTTPRKVTPTRSVRPAPPSPRPAPKPVAAPAPATCSVPAGVTAAQVVLVISSGSSATVRACARSGSGYVLQHGPYAGHVGRNGVSWSKREGDNTTPGGTYALIEGFGNYANPGLGAGSWLRVDSKDVWVEDPASALYNTHQRLPSNGRFGYAESMAAAPAYDYAQVINYNSGNVPGKGSGIFFHVDQGRGTAGCVSLPVASLLTVMRWERPGVVMSIR